MGEFVKAKFKGPIKEEKIIPGEFRKAKFNGPIEKRKKEK